MDQRLQALVKDFSGRQILVVGDVMLDEYVWGEVQRISPEAPVPVVRVRRRTHVPGGAANTAVNVASLGGRAMLAGVIGSDPAGQTLCEALRRHGLSVEGLLLDRERVTTTKTRIVAHQQHVVRIDEEQPLPIPEGLEEQLLQWLERQMPQVEACVLSDYGKGLVSRRLAEQFIGLARRVGRPVVVDPKGGDYTKYRGATVVKPNLQEALQACPAVGNGTDGLEAISRHLLGLLEGSALLFTRGAAGMVLFDGETSPVVIASVARDVFDVTGAGDTVAGTLALALAVGATLPQAAYLANRAAGIVVAKVGTAQVSRDELIREVDGAGNKGDGDEWSSLSKPTLSSIRGTAETEP